MDSCPIAKTIGIMMFWTSWTVGQFFWATFQKYICTHIATVIALFFYYFQNILSKVSKVSESIENKGFEGWTVS